MVKGDWPIAGWKIKQLGRNHSIVTVYGELDFKIEKNTAKSLVPKAGNILS
jgi:CRISPR/Cas system-associated protein Cas5 (RAMP superfamily)